MFFKNERGFSLVEGMIATMLLGGTTLLASMLLLSLMRQKNEIHTNVDAETALLMGVYNLQKTLSLATKLEVVAGSLDGANRLAGEGAIRDYVMDSMNGNPEKIDTVAIFLREVGGHQATPRSDLIPTGIFYSRPGPKKSGVVFITQNTSGALQPSLSDAFFDKVVEFSITNFYYAGVAPNRRISSAELFFTIRRFLTDDVAKWNFCPKKDIQNNVTGCATTNSATFNDVSFKIRVSFSNQILADSDPRNANANSPFERTFGSLYLFPQR